jgi:hypothetical protein
MEFGGSCYQFPWVFFFAFNSAQRYKKSVLLLLASMQRDELRIAIDISLKWIKREPHTKTRLTKWNISYQTDCVPTTHLSQPPFLLSETSLTNQYTIMLAIKKSETNTPSCAVNVLPCRIQHNGPVNASTRHWTPQESSDGKSHTAYFRGRKLKGRVVELPDGYIGMF